MMECASASSLPDLATRKTNLTARRYIDHTRSGTAAT
jgi:hypothetical protein